MQCSSYFIIAGNRGRRCKRIWHLIETGENVLHGQNPVYLLQTLSYSVLSFYRRADHYPDYVNLNICNAENIGLFKIACLLKLLWKDYQHYLFLRQNLLRAMR